MLSTHASNLQTVSSNANIGSIHNSNIELLQINPHHRKERCFSSCLLQLVSPWNKYKPIKLFRKITEPPNSGFLLVTEVNTVRKPCSCTDFNSWSLLGLFADTVLKRERDSLTASLFWKAHPRNEFKQMYLVSIWHFLSPCSVYLTGLLNYTKNNHI